MGEKFTRGTGRHPSVSARMSSLIRSERPEARQLAAVGSALVVIARLFATQSHDPFRLRAYLAALGCCAGLATLTWQVRDAWPLLVGALVYAVAARRRSR